VTLKHAEMIHCMLQNLAVIPTTTFKKIGNQNTELSSQPFIFIMFLENRKNISKHSEKVFSVILTLKSSLAVLSDSTMKQLWQDRAR
jgi:hypothetical protein